jgi:SsrA-binding protein
LPGCAGIFSARRAAFWLICFMPDILNNSKARRDYHILETFEAGIVLKGTEVKALRAGQGQIRDAFARIENDQAFLHNAHIDEYSFGNLQNHEPKGVRKLLLHKSEIRKLFGLASVKGNTLVVLSFYWKNGKVKVLIGVGKGKVEYDKREDIKKRDAERETKRATMHRFKGK